MEVLTKSVPAGTRFKVLTGDDQPGTFEAHVAVFDNVDYIGDRIRPGAFRKTIEAWRASGTLMPFMLHHNTRSLEVGAVQAMTEDEIGLRVKVGLFVGKSAEADTLYASMVAGVKQEFSIGYSVIEAETVVEDSEHVLDLLELDLFEASKVFRGMNPLTGLVDVKSNVPPIATSNNATVAGVRARITEHAHLI